MQRSRVSDRARQGEIRYGGQDRIGGGGGGGGGGIDTSTLTFALIAFAGSVSSLFCGDGSMPPGGTYAFCPASTSQ